MICKIVQVYLEQREHVFRSKVKGLVMSSVGDRILHMIKIEGLVTHPDFRGQGYASALMQHVIGVVSPPPGSHQTDDAN